MDHDMTHPDFSEELMANWLLAIEGMELFRIDPLK